MELTNKIFCAVKNIRVYESQLKPELLQFLKPQLKSAGFNISESSQLSVQKRGSCYIVEIDNHDPNLLQMIVFYEYKLS